MNDYMVRARDAQGHETDWSSVAQAATFLSSNLFFDSFEIPDIPISDTITDPRADYWEDNEGGAFLHRVRLVDNNMAGATYVTPWGEQALLIRDKSEGNLYTRTTLGVIGPRLSPYTRYRLSYYAARNTSAASAYTHGDLQAGGISVAICEERAYETNFTEIPSRRTR